MPDREQIARSVVRAGGKQLTEAAARVDGLLGQLDSHHFFLPDAQRGVQARSDVRAELRAATAALRKASRAVADARRAVGALGDALQRNPTT